MGALGGDAGDGVGRGELGEAFQQVLALAVDVADGDQGGVRAEGGEQVGGECVGVAAVTAEVDDASAPLGGDTIAGALGGVADQEHGVAGRGGG